MIRIYGKPDCIVSDNGTEFTSTAILKWAGDTGVAYLYLRRIPFLRTVASFAFV